MSAGAGARPRRVAIIGGGISGLATAFQLTREGLEWTLFEASGRLGGIVETVHRAGFVIECGPDSWVTEKPWARELAVDLGLQEQIIGSNDHTRRTYVQQGQGRLTHLVPIPDGMRMMVPAKWGPLLESPLFSWQARLAYLREPKRAAELKAQAPAHDESVLDFVRRHFGDEVAGSIAGPLLSAVFGGDIANLSVRAVMPALVRMEAEEGSLIQAVQRRAAASSPAIFTSLATGMQTLVDRIVSTLPAASIRKHEPVLRIAAKPEGWHVTTAGSLHVFDAVVLATPAAATAHLLRPLSDRGARLAGLLPSHSTSAVVVALAFAPEQAARMRIPPGFGFVVPPFAKGASIATEAKHPLLACTFVHQKFPRRAPQGAVLLRAFFGGPSGDALIGESDDRLAARARAELARVMGPMPQAVETVVRRWPQSLPQYPVGHLDRMAEVETLQAAIPGLHLVGSAYYGVGLPDLIRHGRHLGRTLAARPTATSTV